MPPNTEAAITLATGDVHEHSPDDVLLTKAKSNADGLLDVTLTIPGDTKPGTYTVLIQFEDDENVYFKSITVTKAAPPAPTAAKPVSAQPKYTG